MLPKNKLRAKRMKRLKMFVGNEHNYKNITLIPLPLPAQ
jgi:ribosomal protein L13